MRAGRTRAGGALVGLALGGVPGALAAALAEIANPMFVDAPLDAWLTLVAAPGLLGAAVGAALGARSARWPAAVSAACAALMVGLSATDGVAPIPGLELLVYGIDGASWKQADALIANGELEALADVKARGAHGTLLSHEPMFSPLLWTTMAAGKPPDLHGVRGFNVHSTDCVVPRWWDIAEHEGRSIGLFKWLVTWPPRELAHGGFIVPAWLAPSPETWPMELSFLKEIELSERIDRERVAAKRSSVTLAWDGVMHGFRFTTLRDAAGWSVWQKVARVPENERFYRLQFLRARMDRDVFVWALRERPSQIATFTYYATDAVGHRYWKYHEPEAFSEVDPTDLDAYGAVIADAYRQADDILGEIQGFLPPEGRLVVVSDHGFQALDAAKDGILIAPRTDRLGERLRAAVADDVQLARVGARIAVVLPGRDLAAERAALDASLTALVNEKTGDPLFRWEPVPDAPNSVGIDLFTKHLGPGDLGSVRAGGELLSVWVSEKDDNNGDHHPDGLFGATGPGVTPGSRVDADLLDVAPILLAAIGLPRGADMTGAVPPGLWPDPGTRASWDPIRAALPYSTGVAGDDVNTAMLQMLGYVDEKAPTPP
jgi:hypothetical protein